jgi:hypothetical protein
VSQRSQHRKSLKLQSSRGLWERADRRRMICLSPFSRSLRGRGSCSGDGNAEVLAVSWSGEYLKLEEDAL